MKKLSYAAIFLFCACAPTKIVQVKGSYPQPPIITISKDSFDKVWGKTIDYFAQNGIPIRTIDKSSGIIISEKSKLSWSFEDKNGKIRKSNAFVVLSQIFNDMSAKPYVPSEVTGEWNVRIKPVDSGTLINVNLYNIQAIYGQIYYSHYTHTIIEPVKVDGRTTGVFEQGFENAVK